MKSPNWLKEIHLYDTRREYLIKGGIFGISWVLGIRACYMQYLNVFNQLESEEQSVMDLSVTQRALASACLVFSLSLLLEFVFKIDMKQKIYSRIIYLLFGASIFALFFLSLATLGGAGDYELVTYRITVGIMVLFVMDFFSLVFFPSEIEICLSDKEINEDDEESESNIEKKYEEEKRVEEFNTRLTSGNLSDEEGTRCE